MQYVRIKGRLRLSLPLFECTRIRHLNMKIRDKYDPRTQWMGDREDSHVHASGATPAEGVVARAH